MDLLFVIERHLKQTGERPCQFGRRIARDPNLVKDMRNGRQLRSILASRVSAAVQADQAG